MPCRIKIDIVGARYIVTLLQKNMTNPETLKNQIIEKLKDVIDPETGVDVIRMRLVLDLEADEAGNVSYTFRPSSPVCPIAVTLAMDIKYAVGSVEGVEEQKIAIKDYVNAEELSEYLSMMP